MFRLKNPIPESIVDPAQLQKQLEEYKIIPYYGTSASSSHSMLFVLDTLCTLSPAFDSSMRDLIEYAFGRSISITARSEPGLILDIPEVSQETAGAFYEYIKGLNIKATDLLTLAAQATKSEAASGNVWVKVRRVSTLDSVRYTFKVVPFKHVAYLKQEDHEEPYAIITPVWGDKKYWNESPPEELQVTKEGDPLFFNDKGNGIEVALVHFRKPGGSSGYYGRPDILSVLNWLYVDYVLSDLSAKIAGTEIVSKKIVALEERGGTVLDNDESETVERQEVGANGRIATERASPFRVAMNQLKKLTTNIGDHGDAASIVGIQYPQGNKAPIVLDLELNRDSRHHDFLSETATRAVSGVLGWTPELTGLRQAKANIGGNTIRDLFVIKNTSTIKPIQAKTEDRFNWLLGEILEREGAPANFMDLGVSFPGAITEIIDELKGAEAAVSAAGVDPSQSNNPINDNE